MFSGRLVVRRRNARNLFHIQWEYSERNAGHYADRRSIERQKRCATQVTLDANTVTVPSGAVAIPTTASLHVIKLVINSNGGVATPSDFNVHVENAGVDVSSSPQLGTSTPGTAYVLPAGTYAISEDADRTYRAVSVSWASEGIVMQDGSITPAVGDNKTCTIVNSDIPALVAPPAPVVPAPVVSNGGGGGGGGGMIVPLIGITKVPTPLTLPAGSGSVTYNYTVWNVGGEVPLTNITVTDDACSPVTYVSGDTNSNGQIDLGEAWKYTCTTTLARTTTNTAIATGHGGSQTAVATADCYGRRSAHRCPVFPTPALLLLRSSIS